MLMALKAEWWPRIKSYLALIISSNWLFMKSKGAPDGGRGQIKRKVRSRGKGRRRSKEERGVCSGMAVRPAMCLINTVLAKARTLQVKIKKAPECMGWYEAILPVAARVARSGFSSCQQPHATRGQPEARFFSRSQCELAFQYAWNF